MGQVPAGSLKKAHDRQHAARRGALGRIDFCAVGYGKCIDS